MPMSSPSIMVKSVTISAKTSAPTGGPTRMNVATIPSACGRRDAIGTGRCAAAATRRASALAHLVQPPLHRSDLLLEVLQVVVALLGRVLLACAGGRGLRGRRE